MTKEIMSIREALLHEALKDIDALIEKIAEVDASLSNKIDAATREALGRSFHAAQNNFKAMIDDKEAALLAAGQSASATINAQFTAGVTQLVGVNESLESKAWRFIFILTGIAILGGVIGGVVAAKLIGY